MECVLVVVIVFFYKMKILKVEVNKLLCLILLLVFFISMNNGCVYWNFNVINELFLRVIEFLEVFGG